MVEGLIPHKGGWLVQQLCIKGPRAAGRARPGVHLDHSAIVLVSAAGWKPEPGTWPLITILPHTRGKRE
jgi:hypothetical protein